MISNYSLNLILLPVIFLVCVSLINCYEVNSMDEFSTQHGSSDNVKSPDLAPPKPGWIDPFDMLGGSATHHNNLIVQSDVDNYVLTNRLKKCETYMRRFINVFLRSVAGGDSIENFPVQLVEKINLEFLISQQEFITLQKFGEHGKCDGQEIEDVSELLSNILSQTFQREKSYYGIYSFLNWIQNIFSKLVNSPEWAVVISISILFLTTAWMIYNHFYLAAFLTFSTTVFMCGFGFNWIRMYEEKESEKYANLVMHGNAPYHCQGKHMKWHEHMYYRMFGTDCNEFYKTRDVRSIIQISPTDVLVETVSSMIVIPLKYVCEVYGHFVGSVTDSVPFWLQPVAIILGAIIPLLFFLLLLTFLFRYRLSISWTGFYFAPVLFQSRETIQPRTNTKYVEDLSKKSDTELKGNVGGDSEQNENSKSLFVVMNMMGLKKLVSKPEISSGKDNAKVAAIEDGKCDKKDSAEHSDSEETSEIKEMEELLVLLQENKNPEQCKRRSKSIFTVTDGTSSNKDTLSRSEDDKDVDLESGNDEVFLSQKDNQTEIKNKTI